MPCVVLVVDDVNECRLMTCALLESLGYRSFSVPNAAAAFEMLAAIAPDQHLVLVTDQNMPGIFGVDLCREMKLRKRGCATILVTGDPVLALQLKPHPDVDVWLDKPFSLADLRDAVDQAIRGMLGTGTGMTPAIFPSTAA